MTAPITTEVRVRRASLRPWLPAVAIAVSVAVGCGAKSGIELGDASVPDAGPPPPPLDAGAPVPARDAGTDGGPLADEPLPPELPPGEPPPPVLSTIAAGGYHTCAVMDDGSVRCWGDNESEALGFDTDDGDVPVPTTVPGVDDVVSVSAGSSHSCALRSEGVVTCWGANRSGQLGHGPAASPGRTAAPRPPGPVIGLSAAVRVGAGAEYTVALTADGVLHSWGGNLQDPDGPDVIAEPTIVPGLDPLIDFEAGDQHACVVDVHHHVTCWGSSHQGAFGRNSRYEPLGPTPVPELDGAVQVAGDSVNCALMGDGTVSCCPITDGSIIIDESCQRVPYLTGAVHIAASEGHACAILRDGTVWCWGFDNSGTIGIKTEGSYVPRPVRIHAVENAVELASGYAHVCARTSAGEIWCWGKNDAGQLGTGTIDSFTHAPVRVELGS